MPITAKCLLENISENREQWLELRKNKVSSSNIAAIAGLSKYKSPLEVWANWTGKVPDTFYGNAHTELGQVLEPFAAKLFAKRHDVKVTAANALYQHVELDWAIASPDYFFGDWIEPTVLEIKTGSYRQAEKWASGNAPDEYVTQVVWQLGVLGLNDAVLSPFLGLDLLEVANDVPLKFDEAFFASLVEKAEEFRELVQRDIPPNAGAGDSNIIRKLFDRQKGKSRKLAEKESLEIGYMVSKINQLKELSKPLEKELKSYEEEKKRLENQIKVAVGDCDSIELESGELIKVTRVSVDERMNPAYSYDRLSLPKLKVSHA